MDKTAIKKYAVWARRELIARVTQKAEQYEITEKKTSSKDAESINGRLLTDTEKNQRKALIEKIQADGFEQVMEEVAYTWFNRFIALRFMEVNNYLPNHTRVFTNEAGEYKPQILADAIQLDLEGLDMDKVFELKDANKTEELYKYLLITQCNTLSAVLPRMFQKIEHYTELLLPDYLLREGSVIEQMISLIPEEDWTDQVQIIGWLYQYYNSEPKDAVFAALKKNVKISKENIPAATQLFTPDWIVRYMVENSLGRLWLEGHPNDVLKSEWKYYLDETEQEADVQKQLEAIRKEYANLKPEDIRCIDPCMGSGHILCYMFDVLVKIYEDYGYTAHEAVENIVEKNLWGLDIDERATQLSYFAVMMKARQYDRRFLTRGIQPHVYAIEESNGITSAPMHDMGIELSQEEYGEATKQAMRLVGEMHDAKEYGSIIHVTPCDWELLRRFAVPRGVSEGQIRLDIHGEIEASTRLQILINLGEILAQKYHVVVTNPPYMRGSSMPAKLSTYVKSVFPDSKNDLFAVFIEQCGNLTKSNGYQAMITQQSWMFLSGYERLRDKLRYKDTISLIHLGAHAFEEIGGEVVQTVSFVMQKIHSPNRRGEYVRLVKQGSQQEKEAAFLSNGNRYSVSNDLFMSIPGKRIVYWLGSDSIWEHDKISGSFVSGGRNKTHNNEKYVREWWEVAPSNKWVLYMNGGNYRKWYGNLLEVVDWSEAAKREYASHGGLVDDNNVNSFGISWNGICGDLYGFRIKPVGIPFSSSSPTIVNLSDKEPWAVLGFLNTVVSHSILTALNPTLQLNVGEVLDSPLELPENCEKIETLAMQCVALSKEEWDSFETSRDFQIHPLARSYSVKPEDRAVASSSRDAYVMSPIEDEYVRWMFECDNRFDKLKRNEEELNHIFIEIYGLQDDLTPEEEDKDVTVRKADLQRDIRSFISYAVGCMFGRYSLDAPGLAYAGVEWNASKYTTIQPDKDAIIPICDDEYFNDDIVGRFIDFIEAVYGNETREENLKFIADALGGKGSSREVIRNYFINDFFRDHCKIYQKRPIYWLFDSGKKNGFKCLIYMHRYKPDTIARIRTDYVHEQQSRYRTVVSDLESRISAAGAGERVKLTKQLNKIQDQAEELRIYEEKIHHLADQMIQIDLNDGVKVNYAKFQTVLAKIK